MHTRARRREDPDDKHTTAHKHLDKWTYEVHARALSHPQKEKVYEHALVLKFSQVSMVKELYGFTDPPESYSPELRERRSTEDLAYDADSKRPRCFVGEAHSAAEALGGTPFLRGDLPFLSVTL